MKINKLKIRIVLMSIFGHEWGNARSASQPSNESYPVYGCKCCLQVDEVTELEYCKKWYRKFFVDTTKDNEELPF